MRKELMLFLEKTVKYELKWMYHYDVEDIAFGVQTDKYSHCKNVLEGKSSVQELLEYFEKYYPNDESHFIEKLKELM